MTEEEQQQPQNSQEDGMRHDAQLPKVANAQAAGIIVIGINDVYMKVGAEVETNGSSSAGAIHPQLNSEEATALSNMLMQMANSSLTGAPIELPKMDTSVILKIMAALKGNPFAHLFGDVLGRALIEGIKPANAQGEFIQLRNISNTNLRVNATHAIVEDTSEESIVRVLHCYEVNFYYSRSTNLYTVLCYQLCAF